ncbi:Hypothetical protein, putative, partial [Bodo saltans]
TQLKSKPTKMSTTVPQTAARTPAKKASRNKLQQNAAERALTVYDTEMTHCFTVPQDRIAFAPTPANKDRQLCLCPQYSNSGFCPQGEACTEVHANVEGLEKMTIHINYAWKSAESVSYARLNPGETLSVLAPNNRPPLETLESELVLVTKGSLSRQQDPAANPPARPLSHCAHYYFNRICNRGEQCSFIHAVNIDPSSEEGQRAAAPQVVHRSTKAANSPSGDESTGGCSQSSNPSSASDVHISGKQCCLLPTSAAESLCSESGYTSDSSTCSGKTVGPISEASAVQSPAAPVQGNQPSKWR